MRRYSTPSLGFASSATTATRVFPIGFITGSGRVAQIYDIFAGVSTASQDVLTQTQINLTSTLITAGTGITPANIDSGSSAPAAVTGASSAPTGATISGVPLLHMPFNGRVTVRWVAPDPDGRIIIPAGGAAAGCGLVSQQQVGTATFNTDHTVYFAE